MLQTWKIKLKLSNTVLEDDPGCKSLCARDAHYRTAQIFVFLPNITSKKMCRAVMVHELVHLILTDYDYLLEKSGVAKDNLAYAKVCENTTEQFSRIILESDDWV